MICIISSEKIMEFSKQLQLRRSMLFLSIICKFRNNKQGLKGSAISDYFISFGEQILNRE